MLNFFSKIDFTRSLKKKLPIEYKNKAPIEIEITETNVPTICPNNIPEIIKIGEPKPSNVTQIIANTKDVVYTIITGILFYLYNYTLTVACKIAPNIGYVKSIDCLGIVATVILSNIIFGTKLNIESYIGIGLTILGIIGVSI